MKLFESFSSVYKSFLISGGKIHANGILLGTLNSIVMTVVVVSSVVFGEIVPTEEIDLVDLIVESTSVVFIFLMSTFVSFISIKRLIKYWLFVGLFFLQTGVLLDSIDEIVIVTSIYWHRIGDILFLIGVMITAISSVSWTVFAYQTSTLDKLTQIHNRHFFEAAINQYLSSKSYRANEQLNGSLICLDLDNFKHINDAYGHTMGDKVLQIVGNVLKQSARQGDIVCRSGGEEFEILLANANVEEASEVARRILTNLAHNTPDGIPTITASIGVTDIRQSDYNDSLRQRADEAMYQAKKQGKARINVFSNT